MSFQRDLNYGEAHEGYALPFLLEYCLQFGAEYIPKTEATDTADFKIRTADSLLRCDVKALRGKSDLCLELFNYEWVETWAFRLDRVLMYCGGSGRWYWVKLDILRKKTTNFDTLKGPYQVASSGSWVKWLPAGYARPAYGVRDVTEALEAAYLHAHGSPIPYAEALAGHDQQFLSVPNPAVN